MSDFLSVKEFAARIGVSLSSAQRLLASRKTPFYRFGRQKRIAKADAEAMIADCKRHAIEPESRPIEAIRARQTRKTADAVAK